MRTTEDQVTDLGLDYPLDKVFIKDNFGDGGEYDTYDTYDNYADEYDNYDGEYDTYDDKYDNYDDKYDNYDDEYDGQSDDDEDNGRSSYRQRRPWTRTPPASRYSCPMHTLFLA